MSINALTNAALARRPDFEPANRTPTGIAEIAQAAGAMPAPVAGPAPSGAPAPAQGVNAALQTLTTYIPTEVLTLYVAAVAALSLSPGASPGPSSSPLQVWLPFGIFLVVTPVIVWLAFATKIKSTGLGIPANPRTWPMWEMSAATIAFAAWAFAFPNTPFLTLEGWYNPSIAGLAVLVVSYGLGAVSPLMQRSLPKA
jgi:hypothetical protein